MTSFIVRNNRRQRRVSGRVGLSVLAIGLVLLSAACGVREDILPGPRFDLRDLDEAQDLLEAEQGTDSTPVRQKTVRKIPNPPYSVDGEPTRISLPGARALSSWPQRAYDAQNAIPHAQLRQGTLTQVWETKFGVGNKDKRRISAVPVAEGGRVFVMDSEMLVSAIGTSGAILWQRSLVPASETVGQATGGGLAVSGGRLYVTTGYGALHVLDAATGAEIWTQRFDAAAGAAPAIDGGLVYVVTRDGLGSAVDAKTGRIVWQFEGTTATATVMGSGTPAIAGNAVVFPFATGELSAVLKQAGVSLWTNSVTGRRIGRAYSAINGIAGGPVVSGRTIYSATSSGRLAAIDSASGARLWTALEGATGPLLVAGGSIFVMSDQAQLLRLDAGSGNRVWAATLPLYETEKVRARKDVFVHYGPVLAGGRLLLASSDGLLREVDPASGTLLRATALGKSGAAADPIVVGGTLYVVTDDGTLHAYR